MWQFYNRSHRTVSHEAVQSGGDETPRIHIFTIDEDKCGTFENRKKLSFSFALKNKSLPVVSLSPSKWRQSGVSSPLRMLGQTIFPHYNSIRMSGLSFKGTHIPLTVTTPTLIQQRSLLLIYWFHTMPPRSTITFSIKFPILSDGV